MQYTVIINNESYDLPKFNLSIKKEMDIINSKISNTNIPIEDRIKVMWNFLISKLGEDNTYNICEGTSVDTADLCSINIAYLAISNAYDKPIIDYNKQSQNDLLDSDVINKINQIAKSAQAIQTIPSNKK